MCISYQDGISIILPVYNNENSLERCINSVLNQTYKNFELLIIDDGSSDLSSFICKKYINQDHRVRYYYKKNGGVCSARNIGLNNAQFKYITFIDADDFIEIDHLKNFIKYINKFDLVMQGMRYIDNKNKEVNFLLSEELSTNISIIATNKNEINKKFLNIPAFGWITNKLYKTKIIKENNIRFSDIPIINSDRAFNIYYCLFIRSFIMLRTITYNYTENFSSISHKFIDPMLFVLAAKEYASTLKNSLVFENLSNYIIKYSAKFYIRAVGECLANRANKLKLSQRISIIKYAVLNFIKLMMLKKNTIKVVRYSIQAIKYYIKKYYKNK